MSEFDSNPFENPVDVNPFQDPSVTQVTNSGADQITQFNPFADSTANNQTGTTIPASAAPSQPAVLQPSVEPSPQATAAAAQANLLRQQEELERKAAELDRREQELQNRGAAAGTGRENNWPPLPRSFPIKPCFYQDFSEEIPVEHQRLCKMLYYLWMFHCVTLFLNLLACLAAFTTNSNNGVDFGLSILWFVLFSPCSFLCWFRPAYKAFRSDSSFNFFFYFFVFFFQIAVFVIQTVGIPGWGNSGWIAAMAHFSGDHKAVGIVMMVVAVFFTVCAALSVVLLKMVHSHYRHTGASFQKAQQEFSQGVMSNRAFQSAASTAVSSAAQSSFQRN
ncbi:secretory carrier-associated membrane protein 2 isoform X1 [Chanos chanos]|uniref:Secretory carrier-associated membrane protein n=1 Tax=Chanos chanos TaxID=29144 RepID=A0A6J2VEM7_CHACN|nr:secretory carrier-associated membrane protein 2 isoform X1 [Chanos chanos]